MSRELTWSGLPFAVSIEIEPGRLFMRVRGELDIASAPALEQALADALASVDGAGPIESVHLDLAELEFVDVAGARSIGRCEDFARGHGLGFAAVRASRQARFVFELCGLTEDEQT